MAATKEHIVDVFHDSKELVIKDIGVVNKFLGMLITHDDDDG